MSKLVCKNLYGFIIRYVLVQSLFCFKSFGQLNTTEISKQRPTTGVVLSGGGAKGMAHLGLLKMMDSLNIRVDCIGGTSMGSIIASLYASGYSAKEIEARLLTIDWDYMFSDDIPLNEVSIEEKYDYGRFQLDIPFSKKGVVLPSGLIKGRNLYNEFVKLTFPVIDKSDFNHLAIPLRINAVNLEKGENVIFTKGFLPSAMKASMTIPFAFYPVSTDSGFFVDGGILRNTLIPEIKAFGTDYTIVSFTGNKLENRKEFNTLTGILGRSMFISGSKDLEDNLNKVDLFVAPNVSGKDAASFKKSNKIINAGNETIKMHLPELIKLSQDSARMRKTPLPEFHSDKLLLNEVFIIDSIIYTQLKGEPLAFFKNATQLHQKQEATLQLLFDAIKNAYSTLRFSYIYYELIYKGTDSTGKKIIHIKFRNEYASNSNVRVGVHFDSDEGAGAYFNVIVRDKLLKRSRIVIEGDLGYNPKGRIIYQAFLNKRYNLIVGTRILAERDNLKFYDGKLINQQLGFSLFKSYTSFQYNIIANWSLTSGYEIERNIFNPKINDFNSVLFDQKLSSTNHGILSILDFNTLNRIAYPTKGFHLKLKHKFVSSSNVRFSKEGSENTDSITALLNLLSKNYNRILLLSEKYVQVNPNLSLQLGLNFGIIPEDDHNLLDQFYSGSLILTRSRNHTFSGYRNSELRKSNFASLNFGVQYEFFENAFLLSKINAGVFSNSFKDLTTNTLNFKNNKNVNTSGFSFGIGYLLKKIGPVSVQLHKSFDRSLWFGFVSFGYRIQTY